MRQYEGMFLLDTGRAVKDWDETMGVVSGTLERYGATLGLNGKWDERKLSYPVKAQKRGTYYLAYFQAPTDSITKIREDLLLREEVLRFLILQWPEDVALPETLEQKPQVEEEEDDRRGGFGGGRRRGPPREDRGGRSGGDRPSDKPPEKAPANTAGKTAEGAPAGAEGGA